MRRSILGPQFTLERVVQLGAVNPRTGRAASTNKFFVYDASMRLVKDLCKAAAVAELVDALSINAANPLVVLTQTLALEFGNKDPGVVFRAYAQAAQFDEIDENLAASGRMLNRIDEAVSTDEKQLEVIPALRCWA